MIILEQVGGGVSDLFQKEELRNLIGFLDFERDPFFFDILHSGLLICRDFQRYKSMYTTNFRTRALSRRREYRKKTETFLTLFNKTLCLSEDVALQKKLSVNQDELFGLIRGAILESIVIKFVGEKRFQRDYSQWAENTLIKTDSGEQIFFMYLENNKIKRKENIDIAAWKDEVGGEFFECKLAPQRFQEENILFLRTIYNHLKEENEGLCSSTSIGGITLYTTAELESQVESYGFSWFVSIGRDRILELSKNKIMPA